MPNKTNAPEAVISAIENDRQSGELPRKVTSADPAYQASLDHPGLVERIYRDGRTGVGTFKNGVFKKI